MVRKLILERLEALGLNMAKVSLAIGRSHAYLQQFLKRGTPVELHERERILLAQILGVSEDQLRGPSAKLPKKEYVKVVYNNPDSSLGSTQPPPLGFGKEQNAQKVIQGADLFGHNDLPVFGTAQGGQGALIVTDHAVDWIARPSVLLRVQDGYGIIVTGDSMEPEHKEGSVALVNPHLPPRVGNSCVFRSHADDGAVHVIIKELRGETESMWKVRQHNPKKDFTLKKSEWQICHKTVGNYFP